MDRGMSSVLSIPQIQRTSINSTGIPQFHEEPKVSGKCKILRHKCAEQVVVELQDHDGAARGWADTCIKAEIHILNCPNNLFLYLLNVGFLLRLGPICFTPLSLLLFLTVGLKFQFR